MLPETCANIAQNLPVTLQPDIGLYTWNTDAYKQIVSSPAYLAFVFQRVGAGNMTIKVPFALLNLMLESPIVSRPQQYFPCRPFYANDDSGKYEFGKAFLQATFIGMNWGESKWFMAQAPGPGAGASNVQTIGPNDTSINSDPIDNFGTTWAKTWTPLPPSRTVSPGKSSSSGLSSGAKTGIGIAGGLVGFALIRATLCFIFRMLRRRGPMEHQQRLESKFSEQQQHDPSPHYQYHAVGEKDARQAFEIGMGVAALGRWPE